VLALLAGIATPALAWWLFGLLELLPFRVTRERMIGAAIACAALIALAALGARFDPQRLRARALHAAVAAALVGLPLFIGTGWARWDYARTRDREAQRVIDALARYYQQESVYPETLRQLVESGLLDAVPTPKIGFDVAGRGEEEFTYQAFGTSYLLEFSAPRWVQCAYNPPYEEEEEEFDAAGTADVAQGGGEGPAAGGEGEDLGGGAWSCPSKPPELW
jgi:hypothetical protein